MQLPPREPDFVTDDPQVNGSSDSQRVDALNKDANQGDLAAQKAAQERMRAGEATSPVNASTADDKATPKSGDEKEKEKENVPPVPERPIFLTDVLEKLKANHGDYSKLTAKEKKVYEELVRETNRTASELAARLIKSGIRLPLGCPIKVEDDKAGLHPGDNLFFSEIASGDRVAKHNYLETVVDGTKKTQRVNLDELVSAIAWSKTASGEFEEAEINAEIDVLKKQLTSEEYGDNFKGWLPKENMSQAEKEDWLKKIKPWVHLTLTAKTYFKACESMNKAAESGFANHWSFSRMGAANFQDVVDYKTDSPVSYKADSTGKLSPVFKIPQNLEINETNNQMMKRIEKWLDKVSGPLHQATSEFALSTAERNPARACMWGPLPPSEIDKGTRASPDGDPTYRLTEDGKQYNKVECRFDAQPVKVSLVDDHGKRYTEERIKVTTEKQKKWASPLSYEGKGFVDNIGEPETSGLATAKIVGQTQEFKLEPKRIITIGSVGDMKISGSGIAARHAELRLTEDGRIQVKSKEGSATYIIKGQDPTANDSPKKILLKSNEWIDLDPGDKLQIGEKQIAFNNDTRLYKPNDWVTIQGNNGYEIMQAKDLDAWASETEGWENANLAISLAMDVGFIATGTMEAGLVLKWGIKGAGWKVAQNALWHLGSGLTGLGRQTIENMGGHGFMQVRDYAMMVDIVANARLSKRATKLWGAIVGEADDIKMARFLAGKPNIPLGGAERTLAQFTTGVQKATGPWYERSLADLIRSPKTFGQRFKDVNDVVQKWTQRGFAANMIYNAHIKPAGETIMGRLMGKGYAQEHMQEASPDIADKPWLPPVEKIAERLVAISDQKTQELIQTSQTRALLAKNATDILTAQEMRVKGKMTIPDLVEKAAAIKENQDAEAQKFAFAFAKSKNQTQKIAALLGLMTLRQQSDGSLPEILATYPVDPSGQAASDGKTQVPLTLVEAERFFFNYKPLQLRSTDGSFDKFDSESLQLKLAEYTRGLAPSNSSSDSQKGNNEDSAQTLIAETQRVLSLSKEEQKDYIEKLASRYCWEDSKEIKTAAVLSLLLLNTDGKGAISQSLCPTSRSKVAVKSILDGKELTELKVSSLDGRAEAMKRAKEIFDENNLAKLLKNNSLSPEIYNLKIKEQLHITASEAVDYLRQQLGESKNVTHRLALADALHSMGQLSSTELAGICQDIINEPNTTTEEKAAALVDPKHPRLLELLPLQRHTERTLLDPKINPAQKEKILAESLGRDSYHLQQSVLQLARANDADADLRTLALSILQVNNIADSQKQVQALVALQEAWQNCSDPKAKQGHFFSQNFIGNCKQILSSQDQIPDSFESRQKLFQAALSMYEFNQNAPASAEKVANQRLVLSTMLHCLKVEGEASEAATTEVRRLDSQIIPILIDNFARLDDTQKQDFREKAATILSWPGRNDESQTVQTQKEVLKHINTLQTYCTPEQKKALVNSLKQLVRNASSSQNTFGYDGVANGVRQEYSELGTMSIFALNSLTDKEAKEDTLKFFEEVFKDKSIDPQLRRAAFDLLSLENDTHLNNCLAVSKSEQDPALKYRLESLIALQGRQEPNSVAYQDRYQKTKDQLEQVKLNADINLAQTKEHIASHLFNLAATDFSNVMQTSRFPEIRTVENVLDGIKLLEAEKDAPALAYVILSDGRPFFDRHREVAVKAAANSLYNLCRNGSPAERKQIAPFVLRSISEESFMPRQARETLASAITWLDPGLKDGVISKEEAATALSCALKHEQKILPSSLVDSDFKASQDLQLHLLKLLSRYASPEQIPLLTAMSEEKSLPDITEEKATTGAVTFKIPYSDNTIRFVTQKNGEILAFGRVTTDGNEFERWTKDRTKDVFYSSTDLKKENPWDCCPTFKEDGTFVVVDPPNASLKVPYECYVQNDRAGLVKTGAISPGGTLVNTYGTETTYLPSGAKIERSELGPHGLAALWICITYPDGSSRGRVISQDGRAHSSTVYRPGNQKPTGGKEKSDLLLYRPDWLNSSPVDKSTLTRDNNIIDYASGNVIRKDYDTTDSSRNIYTTTLYPNGRVTCDQETEYLTAKARREAGEKKPPIRILDTSQLSFNVTQDMPLVRESARNLLAKLSEKSKPNDLDEQNRDQYERIKVEMHDKSLRSLMELGADWFRKQGKYDLLDGETFGQTEYSRAQSHLRKSLYPWQRPFYSPNFEREAKTLHDEMKRQFEDLVREAQAPDNPVPDSPVMEGREPNNAPAQARAALAYIVLSNGRPFRSEDDRNEAIQLAANGILDICRNKAAGAREMAAIVSRSLITDPTLSSKTRQTLFHALKEMADEKPITTPGILSTDNLADTITHALEAEFRAMPTEYLQNSVRRWLNPAFAESENLQMEMLDYLKNLEYKQDISTLQALFESSTSIPVKYKAKELLRHFDRVGTFDFVQDEVKPAVKAASIEKALKSSKPNEDSICQTIIRNCNSPFSEDGNKINDPRAAILLEAMKSPNERIRVAAALGYSRCSSRSYIEPPEELLLTLYEISLYGKRTVCREEAKSIMAPISWKYKFDPSGDLWTSKIQPRLEALSKAKQIREVAQKKEQ